MIPAGRSELKKAFHQHTSVAENGASPSHNLLTFYAVECGIKSVYLKRNSLNTTKDIRDERLNKSHDLSLWVKILRLPATITGTNTVFYLRRDQQSAWSVARAHEAWRYGIAIRPDDEKRLVGWLVSIQQWVKERL
ncbi:MAG: hypothetical protein ABIG63_08350 [Chloroflexota bacterium]